MNESKSERSEAREVLVRTAKILGGLVLGAATGYAMTKGAEMVIPIQDRFTDLYEGTVTASLALGGAFIADAVAK